MSMREQLQSGSEAAELFFFFFSSRRRHTRLQGDWSSDVCSSDLSSSRRIRNSRRKERLRAKADGAIGDRRPRGNSRQVLRIHALTVEINHVARLGHGDIDAKNCCVQHAVEREQVTIEIRDGKDEASTRPIREANYCTLDVRRVDRVGQNLVYVINGQP